MISDFLRSPIRLSSWPGSTLVALFCGGKPWPIDSGTVGGTGSKPRTFGFFQRGGSFSLYLSEALVLSLLRRPARRPRAPAAPFKYLHLALPDRWGRPRVARLSSLLGRAHKEVIFLAFLMGVSGRNSSRLFRDENERSPTPLSVCRMKNSFNPFPLSIPLKKSLLDAKASTIPEYRGDHGDGAGVSRDERGAWRSGWSRPSSL